MCSQGSRVRTQVNDSAERMFIYEATTAVYKVFKVFSSCFPVHFSSCLRCGSHTMLSEDFAP